MIYHLKQTSCYFKLIRAALPVDCKKGNRVYHATELCDLTNVAIVRITALFWWGYSLLSNI